MSRSRRSTGLACVLLACALAGGSAWAQEGLGVAMEKARAKREAAARKAVDADPTAAKPRAAKADEDGGGGDSTAAEFTLDIAGKKVDLRLGEAKTVQINGKPVKLTLAAKGQPADAGEGGTAETVDTKLFKGGGVSFAYPAHIAKVQADLDPEIGLNSWAFDTPQAMLDFQQHVSPDLTPDELRKESVEFMLEDFGGASKCRVSDATITIAGKRIAGTRIEGKEHDGREVVIEIFAWANRKGGDNYEVTLQYAPLGENGTSPQAEEFRSLLEKTFKYVGKAAKR